MNLPMSKTWSFVSYLLHILLKNAKLQPLVQADFAMLPDVFQLPLMVQHLVDDV